MALSREAQVLLEFLEQHPDTLGELLLAEQAAGAGTATPGLDAVRVLRPWSQRVPSTLERLELVHGLRVGLVVSRQSMSVSHRRSELRPKTQEAWVGYAYQLGPNLLEPRIELGGAETAEACCALVDRVLSGTVPGDGLPRYRLL
jgi:hypothetical protein